MIYLKTVVLFKHMDHTKELMVLTHFGLSQAEIDTYLACLKLGGSPASTIAKTTGAKRASIYAVLRSLAEKGFVLLYFKKGKRVYHAVDPQKLPRIYEKKLDMLSSMVPYLKSIEKSPFKPFGLRFIETREELELFYNETLTGRTGGEHYVIGNVLAWEGMAHDFFKRYREQRAKQKIKTRLLLSAESASSNPIDQSLLREVKYLPEKYKFKSTINIFSDSILIISPELESLAVAITVPAMIDVFRSMFDIIWDFID